MDRLPRPLALAALVYLSLRALVLLTGFDTQSHPAYELTIVGNVAHAVQSGNGPPLADFYDNCGGHLVCGLLAAPLYACLGESYLALKLVPLLFGLATLAVVWKLLAPRARPAGAALAVLLLAAGPPTLLRLSLHSMGNHFESLLLFASTYLAWLRWLEGGARPRAGLVFGLCAGFALFFYFGTLLWLFLLALAHLAIRGPRRSLADAARALTGFALGVAPLLWITLATDGRPLRFLSQNLGSRARADLGAASERALELVTVVLPRAGSFPALGPLPGATAEALFLAAFLCAWTVALHSILRPSRDALPKPPATADGQRLQNLRFLPLVLYLPALLVSYSFSRFRFHLDTPPFDAVSLRYMAPHLLVAVLLIGVAFGRLLQRPAPRRVLAGALAVAALSTAPYALALIGSRDGSDGWRYPGWSGKLLARVLLRDVARDAITGELRWDAESLRSKIERLPLHERAEVYEGVGHYLAWSRIDRLSLELGAMLDPFPPRARPWLARGAGSCLRGQMISGRLAASEVRGRLERLRAHEPEIIDPVVQGLALRFEYPLASEAGRSLDLHGLLAAAVPVELRRAWVQGLGLSAGRILRRGARAEIDALRARLGALAASDPEAFCSGVRQALTETTEECLERPTASHPGRPRASDEQ